MLKSSSRTRADVLQWETSIAQSGLFTAKQVERWLVYRLGAPLQRGSAGWKGLSNLLEKFRTTTRVWKSEPEEFKCKITHAFSCESVWAAEINHQEEWGTWLFLAAFHVWSQCSGRDAAARCKYQFLCRKLGQCNILWHPSVCSRWDDNLRVLNVGGHSPTVVASWVWVLYPLTAMGAEACHEGRRWSPSLADLHQKQIWHGIWKIVIIF